MWFWDITVVDLGERFKCDPKSQIRRRLGMDPKIRCTRKLHHLIFEVEYRTADSVGRRMAELPVGRFSPTRRPPRLTERNVLLRRLRPVRPASTGYPS